MAKPRTLANTVADGGPLATPGEVDLPGGVQGSVPYQSAPGQTALLAPGTAGHVLTSGGAGANPTWAAAVTSPAGTTGQVQINNDGSFGALASGTSGQALVSQGAGAAPAFGTLGVAGGGTGATSLAANNVLLGNGTSAVQAVAPGTAGNVLTSNGTTWISAAGSPIRGATEVGSVCLTNTTNLIYYAANPAAQIAHPYWSSSRILSLSGGGGSTAITPPKYSTYYGGWLTWGEVGGTFPTNGFIFFSQNGLDWIPFVFGPGSGEFSSQGSDGTALLAVDETNGRIFIGARNSATSTSGVLYSKAPATQNNNTWTYSGFDTSGQPYGENPTINSMEWVQFTSTTANGAIVFCSGVVNDSTARVYTIAAGATTGTLRVTYSPGGNVNSGFMVWNKTFQRIAIFHTGSSNVRYSATNSFASWSNSTLPSAATSGPGSAAMSGSRLACRTSGTNLRYTSDFTTWSTEVIPQEIQGIWHNGTSWVGVRGQSTGDTGGIYYTSNANPTSWVRSQGGFFTTGTNIAIRSN